MRILGFTHGAHDSSFAIIEDGKIIIHEELERINRIKETNDDIIEYYQNKYGLLDDFDYITTFPHGDHKWYSQSFLKWWLDENGHPKVNSSKKYVEVGHHNSHAINAFYASKFDRALIVSIDGGGWDNLSNCPVPSENNEYNLANGMHPGVFTIWIGEDSTVKPLMYMCEPNLGGLWNNSTHAFGLSGAGPPYGSGAGTIMGMAAYGNPENYRDIYNGSIRSVTLTSEQDRFDFAAALQEYTEETIKNLIQPYIKKYNIKNICLTGGVALNCMMNGKVKHWFGIDNVFVPPVPYDGGLAIGCAQYVYHHKLQNKRTDEVTYRTPYLGNSYNLQQIENTLNNSLHDLSYTTVSDEEICGLLINQNIVSLFGGKSESGRRALGNRSIIADPRNFSIRELINQKTKHRDWFRPLAPSILEEETKEWFVEDIESPYMSFAIKFKEDKKELVKAVVHADGTGRLQTVSKELNPRFHKLLTKWYEITNVPILLNTSFNDKEPIVETPEDALNCFFKTKIDFLYFTDYNILVSKKNENNL